MGYEEKYYFDDMIDELLSYISQLEDEIASKEGEDDA